MLLRPHRCTNMQMCGKGQAQWTTFQKSQKVEYGTKYHEVYQKYWIIANPQEYECSAWKDAWIRR